MIIRARPKYIENIEKIGDDGVLENTDSNMLFFNKGRTALYFLLKHLQKELAVKNPSILIQSFNCRVVAEAALRAGWFIKLIDISNRGDFSVSLNSILKLNEKPIALLLTHYQGIPNFDYEKIADYCKKNNIILIEDLAQTYASSINNVKVGTLGDFYIESYAFDKPFSVWTGGSLGIKDLKSGNFLIKTFEELPVESDKRAKRDITWLQFLLSKSNYYNNATEWDSYLDSRVFLDLGLRIKHIERIKTIKSHVSILKFLKIMKGAYSNLSSYLPKKLNPIKIDMILRQKKRFKFDFSEIGALERYLVGVGYTSIIKRNDLKIHWNRYSIMDSEGKYASNLKKLGVQVGNYNWPNPLHKMYFGKKNIEFVSFDYCNSEIAAKNVCNIPVWSNFFTNLKTEFINEQK